MAPLPTLALPRKEVISASQGLVFPLVMGSPDPVMHCDVKWLGLECFLVRSGTCARSLVTGNLASAGADIALPCLVGRAGTCLLLPSSVQTSHSHHVSASCLPTNRWAHLPPHKILGLGHPNCGSHHSLPRVGVCSSNLYFFSEPPPSGKGPDLSTLGGTRVLLQFPVCFQWELFHR